METKKISFARQVKDEICKNWKIENSSSHLLFAIFKNSGSIEYAHDGYSLSILTKIPSLAKLLKLAVLNIYPTSKIEMQYSKSNNFSKFSTIKLIIKNNIEKILKDLEKFSDYSHHHFNTTIKRKALIVSSFLTSASINSPESSNYHLEFKLNNPDLAKLIFNVLNKIKLNSTIFTRQKFIIVYIKKTDNIVDLLKFMGATETMFFYENKRLERQISNNLVKLNNVDIANQLKTINASDKQISIMQKILKSNKISLSEKERDLIRLRVTYPDYSLTKLTLEMQKLKYKVSRSGVQHQIRKIMSKIS